ncbi:hypothetical protein EDB85DRAFT_1899922 [Lactarius pseudohatsudake]|nr:hypothetical protein EDB85DRAFT_1899922 [Lactarius pseudohatsudake]
MASLLHTEKPGSYWGWTKLVAYNITIKWQDTATFFGVKTLPPPAIACKLLTKFTANEMKKDMNYRLLRYMDLAMDPIWTDFAVDNFAVQTLLNYAPKAPTI